MAHLVVDNEYDIRSHGHTLVKKDGTKGLSEQDAVRATELFNQQGWAGACDF